MAQATFRHGDPIMIDWVGGSGGHSAGDIIDGGDMGLVIAHRDIAAGDLGAVAAGGGVYAVEVDNAHSVGDMIYWDAADEQANADNGNPILGRVVEASAEDGDVVMILHERVAPA